MPPDDIVTLFIFTSDMRAKGKCRKNGSRQLNRATSEIPVIAGCLRTTAGQVSGATVEDAAGRPAKGKVVTAAAALGATVRSTP